MKKRIISIGKTSKNYLIIILLSFVIGSYTFTLRFYISDNKELEFRQNSFMIEVVKYLFLILCFIPELIRNRNLKKKKEQLKLSWKYKCIIFSIFILLLINSISELFIYKKKISEILLLSSNNSFLVLTIFIISKFFLIQIFISTNIYQ